MPQNIVTSSGKDVDQVISVGTFPNNSTKPLGTFSDSSIVSLPTELSIQQTMMSESLTPDEKSVSELKHQPSTTSDEIVTNNEYAKTSNNSQCVIQKEESNCVGVQSKICQKTQNQPVYEESESKSESSACTLEVGQAE
uniref:Uncharacterized protein LOC8268130 n=1 Tax=Rhizophora mucronata TaxID=61149 RepID=A0A2P2KSR3_RHIMU